MTEADFAAWAAEWRTPPAPIVPVPALTVISSGGVLRGARVMIGLPGHGWRTGLRGDTMIRQGARSLIPVLAEAEWYRAERERVEVFAALVPVERVWVETISTSAERTASTDSLALVSLDSPPTRVAVPAEVIAAQAAGQLTGRRLVQVGADGEQRGLRAVTEAHSGPEGNAQVRVAQEHDWYRWAATGQAPATRAVPISDLWLE
ncbi:hypothetical protein [Catellatospora citrea]|uniref:Uncharacterized protein n=1 Tax=Catellatospora citrea TaxID=53366 RepID=A0A8J3KWI4_9ACTN|nr:hypothetical protein [Catellatospora citrea]RKE08652.1 hypothetical protein C8E86_3509 [Catellatospora citrea]GIG02535.1 hypothetical protein Cci01nite_76280 [Catellatospora citrea]